MHHLECTNTSAKINSAYLLARARPGNYQFVAPVFLLSLLIVYQSSIDGVAATKCHLCLFHLAHCTNPLDCYNQPDTCSNTNFSPIQSQTVDCEFGCEQYVITDATGSIVVWRRGCASEKSPRSSYVCFSRNIYFLRHEQCWCHQDYCNSSTKLLAIDGILRTTSLIALASLISSVYMVADIKHLSTNGHT